MFLTISLFDFISGLSQQERRHQSHEDPEACQRLRQEVQPSEKENFPKNFLNNFSSTASVNYFSVQLFWLKSYFCRRSWKEMPRQLLTLLNIVQFCSVLTKKNLKNFSDVRDRVLIKKEKYIRIPKYCLVPLISDDSLIKARSK